MSMDWWRAHHGISNDSKLAVIAQRAKSRKCEVGWVWIVLLDFASQNEERGSIIGLDDEQVAIMSDIPLDQVSTIIEQFRQRGLIQQDGRLSAWNKRQPSRERPDDNSAERVRRFRGKQREETPCNATERPDKIREEEIREEENTHTSVRAALPNLRKANADDLNGQTSQRFDGWFEVWAAHRGNAYRMNAASQYISVVTVASEKDLMECTQSYVAGPGADASHGYRPDRFLAEMARDSFQTRWPAQRAGPQRQETPTQSAIRKAKEAQNGTR